MSDDDEGIELQPLRARTATCVLVGKMHEGGRSYATVRSTATHLQDTDRVVYEIAWDAAVAPAGHGGLNATAGNASGFVVDKSQDGEAIGEKQGHYFREDGDRVFRYNDEMQWAELNGGSWRFRLRVENAAGSEVARSDEVEVDWRH